MKQLVLSFLCLLSVVSCVSYHTERVVDVNPSGWCKGEVLELIVDEFDTLGLSDLSLILRVDNRFDKEVFPCRISFYVADTLGFTEDIYLDLIGAEKNENKQGMIDLLVKYRSNADLSYAENYLVKFEPTTTNFVGIWALGLKID